MKPHYPILDGLRGTAAILVVIFHLFEAYFPVMANHPMHHGYLAVDFFYLLSGFVVGYAYDDRWGKMSIKEFIKIRLIRLHPLVILGSYDRRCLFLVRSLHQSRAAGWLAKTDRGDDDQLYALTFPGCARLGGNPFAGRSLLVFISGIYCQPDLCVVWEKNE